MDAVTDPLVTDIVVIKSAQVGWTEVIGNVVGYFIHHDPAPTLVVQPTLSLAQAWSKDRLAPMLRDTEVLRGKVKDPRARDSDVTILHKTFPGGHLTMGGANSPAGLAARPIRILLCDDVDRFPPSAGAEGDPLNLARKRTTAFWNRIRLMGSTPTVKGASRIEAAYEASDMRRYWVPCPKCGEYQTLKWSQVQWPEGKPGDAVYVCAGCGATLTDADKPGMLQRGEWRASQPFNGTAGFHVSELYSPWVTWGEMAESFLEAKRLPETLKTWVNTALGETWEEKGETVEDAGLMARRENYGPELPDGVLVLTAAVDVQDDRLEAEVYGHGKESESWSIELKKFYGDPSKQALWDELDDYLLSTFQHERGPTLRIAAVGIDTGGHHTQQVYAFCKTRFARRVFAMKGVGGQGKPLAGRMSRSNAAKIRLFPIGVDTAKELIYSRLKIQEPGPGYCHFPAERDEEYFRQLTAEKVIKKYIRGFPFRVWVKKSQSRRNEILDLRVYGMAALEFLNVNFARLEKKMAARFGEAEIVEPKAKDPEPESQPTPTEQVMAARKRKIMPRRRRGGFVNGWRK